MEVGGIRKQANEKKKPTQVCSYKTEKKFGAGGAMTMTSGNAKETKAPTCYKTLSEETYTSLTSS